MLLSSPTFPERYCIRLNYLITSLFKPGNCESDLLIIALFNVGHYERSVLITPRCLMPGITRGKLREEFPRISKKKKERKEKRRERKIQQYGARYLSMTIITNDYRRFRPSFASFAPRITFGCNFLCFGRPRRSSRPRRCRVRRNDDLARDPFYGKQVLLPQLIQ